MSTLVFALIRAWVRLYTRGVPAELRETRRAEIDSDLWEQVHDDQARGRRPPVTTLHVLGRVLRGVASDLSWRLEHRPGRGVVQNLRLAGVAARRHGWTVFPVLVALSYLSGAAELGTPGFVDTPEQLAMAGGAAAILAGASCLWRGTAPVAAAWLVCLGALAPLPVIMPSAPLSLLWAALAMRAATRRCEALRATEGVAPG
ncbi:MAG: hypothetical protein QOI71_193 [Gaiellales bacterium]|jgi:hypothetical protein|nr:hypothetical protein [Gaiellales bacterium]